MSRRRQISPKARALIAAMGFASALMVSVPVFAAGDAVARQAGQGRWAAQSDPVARMLIEQERKWAVLSCAPNDVVADFIADDFVGTHPRGSLYSAADLKPKGKPGPVAEPEHDCKLLSARVRFYGANIAVIYGRESALVKGTDGKAAPRTLVWTDTVLRRAGRWQVIAVQDMVVPAK